MPRLVSRTLIAIFVLLAAFVAVLAIVGALYQPNTAIPAGFAGKHVTARGVLIRVLQKGSGRDVVLVHGSPGSVEDWGLVMDALSGSFRVTAFDRPGHGYSGDTGKYSFEHNAEMALAVIDTLRLEHVVLVGHSYGGTTALAAALRSSPKIDAYVIVDSATYEPSRKATTVTRILDLPVLGFGVGTLLGPRAAPGMIRAGILEQFGGHTPPEGFVALRIGIWSSPKVTHAIAAETLGSVAEFRTLGPRYPGITRPVHILAQADNPFRRTSAERLHRDIPGSSLVLLSGTGHYLQVEKTREVVEAIQKAAGTP